MLIFGQCAQLVIEGTPAKCRENTPIVVQIFLEKACGKKLYYYLHMASTVLTSLYDIIYHSTLCYWHCSITSNVLLVLAPAMALRTALDICLNQVLLVLNF